MHKWNFITLLFVCLPLSLWAETHANATVTITPVHYLGLVLILISIIFLITEILLPTFGAIGLGGMTMLIIGAILLLDTGILSIPLVITLAAIYLGLLIAIVSLAIRSNKRRIVSGQEALLSAIGIVREDFVGLGWVQVEGETWQAQSSLPLQKGDKVHIVAINGLVLTVKKDQ